jgi:hypothetical protein
MDPIQTTASLAVFAAAVKGMIDALRRQWPRLDGLGVQLVAVAIGAGIAWGFDFQATEALLASTGALVGRVPPDPLDYLVTGGAIAAAAGLFAERSGRSGHQPLLVEIDAEGRPL